MKRKCGPAIVGTGAIAVEVQFPDQAPVDVRGELLVLNGGFEGGVTTLYLHTYRERSGNRLDRHHREGEEDPQGQVRD